MIAYKLDNSVKFKGRVFKLNLAFDVVLRVFDLQKDTGFDSAEKFNLMLDMLIKNQKRLKHLTYEEQAELLQCIFSEFILTKSKKTTSNTKLVDFAQDSNYIYSSFYLDYGIDLQAMQGKLDWRKFIALFQGLSDRTKIKEVMGIRARPIPEMTKYNQKEIANLHELKAYYALDISAEEAEQSFQQSLDKFANKLANMAKGR